MGDGELQHLLGLDPGPPPSHSASWGAGGRNSSEPPAKLQKQVQVLNISSSNFSKQIRLRAALTQCFLLLSVHGPTRTCRTAPSIETADVSSMWIPTADGRLLSKMLGLRDSCAGGGTGFSTLSLEVAVCHGHPEEGQGRGTCNKYGCLVSMPVAASLLHQSPSSSLSLIFCRRLLHPRLAS